MCLSNLAYVSTGTSLSFLKAVWKYLSKSESVIHYRADMSILSTIQRVTAFLSRRALYIARNWGFPFTPRFYFLFAVYNAFVFRPLFRGLVRR